ncbi:c-type cytochrome [Paraburkholderia terrae]|uniref:c-type cytochrome n=1 Tax=Paraburkholderia terrae TaxID=311230 RepID=UPI00296B2CE3|nr:cytochrome c [Paraburkholderia terrae]MDW3658536.1 cytochrome c [Paraburkholderia terrae]
MNAKLSRVMVVWAAPFVLGGLAAAVGSHYLPESIGEQARRQAELVPPVRFVALNVTLPVSRTIFPPGAGAAIASANCVMCHSAGMVLRQPAMTVDEWSTEINKMRSAFGAPIPAEQVDELARYLGVINGRKSGPEPSAVDNQAS